MPPSDAELEARLDLAVLRQRRVNERLKRVLQKQRDATKDMRLVTLELRAYLKRGRT